MTPFICLTPWDLISVLSAPGGVCHLSQLLLLLETYENLDS